MINAFGINHDVAKGLPYSLRPKTGLGFKSDYVHLRRTAHLTGKLNAKNKAMGVVSTKADKIGPQYREAARKYMLKRTKVAKADKKVNDWNYAFGTYGGYKAGQSVGAHAGARSAGTSVKSVKTGIARNAGEAIGHGVRSVQMNPVGMKSIKIYRKATKNSLDILVPGYKAARRGRKAGALLGIAGAVGGLKAYEKGSSVKKSLADIVAEAFEWNRELIKEDIQKASEALLTGGYGPGKMNRSDYTKMQREMNVKRNKGAVVPMSSSKPTTAGRALVPYKAGAVQAVKAPAKPKVPGSAVMAAGPAKTHTSAPNVNYSRQSLKNKIKTGMSRTTHNIKQGAQARYNATAKPKINAIKTGAGKKLKPTGATRVASAARMMPHTGSGIPAAAATLGTAAIGAHMYDISQRRKMTVGKSAFGVDHDVEKGLPSAVKQMANGTRAIPTASKSEYRHFESKIRANKLGREAGKVRNPKAAYGGQEFDSLRSMGRNVSSLYRGKGGTNPGLIGTRTQKDKMKTLAGKRTSMMPLNYPPKKPAW